MLMMRARVQGHRWVDHPAAAVMEARVPGQWVDRPAAVVMEAREQGRCWIDHPAAANPPFWYRHHADNGAGLSARMAPQRAHKDICTIKIRNNDQQPRPDPKGDDDDNEMTKDSNVSHFSHGPL
ncbi:hypothetical protein ACOMHN_018501 [Nucella lapillus]